jgi:23S rRNA pseudouridine1911/1915/1917 synthase
MVRNKPHKVESNSNSEYQVVQSGELMTFLIQTFPEKSRTTIKSLLAHRQVKVNDVIITKYNHTLRVGDTVSVIKGKGPVEFKSEDIKILFEDDYIIVIEKEAGLLSIATSNERERTAYSILRQHIKDENPKNQIFIIHRLDKETSGIMLFAKDIKIQETLQKNWHSAVLERSYIAIVEGVVAKKEDTITSWLKESSAMKMHSSDKPDDGQIAVTKYKVIKQDKQFSMLKVILDTGRKNQIRVHMKEMGHPVVGDKKYGAKTNPIQRMGLHANLLVFKHPVTEAELRFESPIPRKFKRLL